MIISRPFEQGKQMWHTWIYLSVWGRPTKVLIKLRGGMATSLTRRVMISLTLQLRTPLHPFSILDSGGFWYCGAHQKFWATEGVD